MADITIRRKGGATEAVTVTGTAAGQCWIDRNGSTAGHTIYILETGTTYRPVGFEPKAVGIALPANHW